MARNSNCLLKESSMRRSKPQPVRNKIDLADPAQVRAWTRHLDISRADLHRLVEKVGNSITALAKEIAVERAQALKAAAPTIVRTELPNIPDVA
jgi:hypothetical protein